MPDRTGSDSEGNSAGATRDGVSDSNSSNRDSNGGWTGGGWNGFSSNGNNSVQNPDAVADPSDMSQVDAGLKAAGYDPVGLGHGAMQLGEYGRELIAGDTAVYSKTAGPTTFAQLSPTDQERYAANMIGGRPGWYDSADKGFREKMVDGMNWGLSKTGLIGQSLKELGTVPGQTFDEQRQMEKNVPGYAEARYARMDKIAGGIADIALSAAPGGGLIKSGINLAKNMQSGMDFKDALGLAVTDSLKGYAVGAINKEARGLMGPELAGGIDSYNKVATVANMVGAGMPGIPSVGGMIVGAVAGKPSGAPATNASGQPVTNLQGDQIYGGFTSGQSRGEGSSGSTQSPAPQPTAPTPTPPSVSYDTSGMKDAKGFGQAYREAARTRYRR